MCVMLTCSSHIDRSLARTRNPKNPDHKYFAVSPVGDVDVLGKWRLCYDVLCEEDGWHVMRLTAIFVNVRSMYDIVRLFCNVSI